MQYSNIYCPIRQ